MSQKKKQNHCSQFYLTEMTFYQVMSTYHRYLGPVSLRLRPSSRYCCYGNCTAGSKPVEKRNFLTYLIENRIRSLSTKNDLVNVVNWRRCVGVRFFETECILWDFAERFLTCSDRRGIYEDAPVVVDGNLITSRIPTDLPDFSAALLKQLQWWAEYSVLKLL